jgi:hypothetical protein
MPQKFYIFTYGLTPCLPMFWRQMLSGCRVIECEQTKTNSGALVRQLTIPTEGPQLVSEVSANFSG